MIKCRRRQATDPQKLKKIVNGRFFVFCWWKRKRLKNNRFHIPARYNLEKYTRAFIVESFLAKGEFLSQSSEIAQINPFPTLFLIEKLYYCGSKIFKATGSSLKRKPPGRPRSVQTPENIKIIDEPYLVSKTF